jgi:hypothetical protein
MKFGTTYMEIPLAVQEYDALPRALPYLLNHVFVPEMCVAAF